jgi:beta-N-acetylhexosaminidase
MENYMKKILVVLMALVFVAAGVFGILTLGGKAGDPKETAQTTEAVDSSKPDGVSESGDSKNTEDADAGKNDNGSDNTPAEVTGGEDVQDPADQSGSAEGSDIVEKTLADMSLRDKVCQMMFVRPESITGIDVVTAAGDTTKSALEQYPVGGIVYFAQNMESKDQVKEMIDNSQSYSKVGLFISTDEEGGMVNRLMNTVGTTYIDSMYNYKDEGTQKAHDNAYTIASDMAALGFNMDFAPVADVWSNPDNTVIGERAYSDDYSQAAELVGSAVKGFEDGGVMCTLKHFPGHGDTAEDSHYSSAYVRRTKDEIMADEMQPFTAGIDAGAEFVMVGHLIVPDIDELPATLSYKITTEMLRNEMHFDGIAITDSLAMSSIADNYGVGESAVMSIKAGIDMLLDPTDIDTAIDAVVQAVESGDITEDRIDDSVRKILALKEKHGLLK